MDKSSNNEVWVVFGAGDETRTLDLHLGRVALFQGLSDSATTRASRDTLEERPYETVGHRCLLRRSPQVLASVAWKVIDPMAALAAEEVA